MPVTLIITLFASLFVAYIINPVFAVSFMKHEYDQEEKVVKYNLRKIMKWGIIFGGIAVVSYIIGWTGIGNFMIFCFLLMLFYDFVLKHLINAFQQKFWPRYHANLRKIASLHFA